MSCLSPMLRVPKGYCRWELSKKTIYDQIEGKYKEVTYMVDHEKEGTLKEKAIILKDMPSQRRKLEEANIPYEVLPCGHCAECFTKRVRDWSIRLLQEKKFHNESYFITLTFDDRHIPSNRSLSKKHVQKFIKRMRNYIGNVANMDVQFKYFAVGEYGEGKGERNGLNPHYHLAVYSLPLVALGGLSDIFPDGHKHYSKSGDILMYSKFVQDCWPFGFATIQEITFGSASYIAGYVHKKLFDDVPVIHKEADFYSTLDGRALHFIVPVKYEMHKYLGVCKPFSLMSKGLGKDWLESSMDLVYLTDEVFYHSGMYGVRSSKPPRYYDKRFGLHNSEKMEAIKENRKNLAKMKVNVESDSQFFYNQNVKESQILAKRAARKRNLS